MILLRTDRLEWRQSSPDHLEALHRIVSDYDVISMLGSWPYPAQKEFTLIRCHPPDPARGLVGQIFWGDVLIGGMGIVDGDLGYMLGREHWGQGYATEMARAVTQHMFRSYDWPEIRASA